MVGVRDLRLVRMSCACVALLATLAGCESEPPPAYDAVAVAPESHQVLVENDDVRVLRVVVEPGATEPPHVHQWPSVMYIEEAQPITYITYSADGGELKETSRSSASAEQMSEVMWVPPEEIHAIHNAGTGVFRALRVELKHGSPTAGLPDDPD